MCEDVSIILQHPKPILSQSVRREVIHKRGTRIRKLNRRRAIRQFCLICSDFDWRKVANCPLTRCILYEYRLGGLEEKGLSARDRVKAIVRYCTDCAYDDPHKRVTCDAVQCALFPYRNG